LENLGHEVTNEQFYLATADSDVESSGTLDFQEYMSVRRVGSVLWAGLR